MQEKSVYLDKQQTVAKQIKGTKGKQQAVAKLVIKQREQRQKHMTSTGRPNPSITHNNAVQQVNQRGKQVKQRGQQVNSERSTGQFREVNRSSREVNRSNPSITHNNHLFSRSTTSIAHNNHLFSRYIRWVNRYIRWVNRYTPSKVHSKSER